MELFEIDYLGGEIQTRIHAISRQEAAAIWTRQHIGMFKDGDEFWVEVRRYDSKQRAWLVSHEIKVKVLISIATSEMEDAR